MRYVFIMKRSKYSHEGVNTLKSFITSLRSLIEGGEDIYKMALRETINLFLEDHAIHFRL